MSIQALKTELRKSAETARASLSPERRKLLSEQVCVTGIRLLEQKFSDRLSGRTADSRPAGRFTLFSYVPFRTELDVSLVMEWCWQRGGTVVVPKVIRGLKIMSLHIIHSFDDLEAGAWGIREPKMSAPILEQEADIDAMLVPGLAYDRFGGRLGYGGGYYDAFIRRWRDRGVAEPFKAALAFGAQIVPEVPMDEHDFRVDAVVTESEVWTPGVSKL